MQESQKRPSKIPSKICDRCGEPLQRVEAWVHRFWRLSPGATETIVNPYDHEPKTA